MTAPETQTERLDGKKVLAEAKEMERRIRAARFYAKNEQAWQSRDLWWDENYPVVQE